ncbi:MAG: VOC family protein [Planctomycetaceae bacterium]
MPLHQTVPLLVVTDLAASRKFYCTGLGFTMTNSAEQHGEIFWCWLQSGNAAIMLQQECNEDPPGSTRGKGVTFYFLCDDADAVCREITARGVAASKPVVADYGMNQTFVTDPDGYALCFENQALQTP